MPAASCADSACRTDPGNSAQYQSRQPAYGMCFPYPALQKSAGSMTAPSNHSGFAENADRTTSCYGTALNTQGGNDLSGQTRKPFCRISKTQGWASAHPRSLEG